MKAEQSAAILDSCLSKKLGQENHAIIMTSSFSKISVFKMFALHCRTKPVCSNFSGLRSFFKKLRFRDGLVWTVGLERFSFECRKTKAKVITLANHQEHRQYSEPIKTESNYM